MPELPEVETSCRGISPHILKQKVTGIIIRQKKLRWPISAGLKKDIINQHIDSIERRAKYILLKTKAGTAILHLGMSGSLHIVDKKSVAGKHDHIDFQFSNGKCLRLHDPRRFGSVLWTRADAYKHKLLKNLGPEPLSDEFNGEALFQSSRNRKTSIKSLIMNSHIVVGVGNIYACETLFLAKINPNRQACRISRQRYEVLAEAIKVTLTQAIKQGGTTLKDFTHQDGKPGYFKQSLHVYGRADEPCSYCQQPVKKITQQQRSTFYCSNCQS
jgi:formamidopyrimidine-DNA glycosylase